MAGVNSSAAASISYNKQASAAWRQRRRKWRKSAAASGIGGVNISGGVIEQR